MKSNAASVVSSSTVSMRFFGQRAGVFNSAICVAVDDAARAEVLPKFRVIRVVRMLRLLLGIKMVEIAEELVEAVIGRQHLVAVAKMVLAKLTRHVTLLFEQHGDGRIFYPHAFRRTGQTDLGQAGTHRRLAGDKCGAAGRATLLSVPVGKYCTFFRNTVDIRRLVTHDAHVVGADVELADIITPDNQDVGFVLCHRR